MKTKREAINEWYRGLTLENKLRLLNAPGEEWLHAQMRLANEFIYESFDPKNFSTNFSFGDAFIYLSQDGDGKYNSTNDEVFISNHFESYLVDRYANLLRIEDMESYDELSQYKQGQYFKALYDELSEILQQYYTPVKCEYVYEIQVKLRDDYSADPEKVLASKIKQGLRDHEYSLVNFKKRIVKVE